VEQSERSGVNVTTDRAIPTTFQVGYFTPYPRLPVLDFNICLCY